MKATLYRFPEGGRAIHLVDADGVEHFTSDVSSLVDMFSTSKLTRMDVEDNKTLFTLVSRNEDVTSETVYIVESSEEFNRQITGGIIPMKEYRFTFNQEVQS